MQQYLVKFNELPVNETFYRNGNTWRKRSTRTAEIVEPTEPYHGRWFYFSKYDNVVINANQLGKTARYSK